MKSNVYDIATALTGCTALLIDGKVHFRSLKISVASKICHSSTTNVTINNAETRKDWHDKWKYIFLFIMDEDSMSGRYFWA